MSRLFIDITELAHWRGKLTGVPRVMNELSTRFAAEEDSPQFVIWNGHRQAFQKIDFTPDATKQATEQASDNTILPSQKYADIIALVMKVKNGSRVANKVLSIPERTARKLLKPKPFAPLEEIIHLQSGDCLLVLADWHASDTAFVDELVKLERIGVGLIQFTYDMLPVMAPQYSGHATKTLDNYASTIFPLCNEIIVISEYTKKDITKWLTQKNVAVPPIDVIRLGDDFSITKPMRPTSEQFLNSAIEGKDYLLCVGTIEARKNHTLLYYVYKLAKARNINLPKLVIIGRVGWQAETVYEMITTDPETKNQMLIFNGVSDEELTWFYKNCLFSIYPSFYEGWGLPIAESISHGIPCICSNTSSMPEIAGELISYFSPVSTDECLAAISKMLIPSNLTEAKERLKRYVPTTWDQAFEQVEKVLGEIHAKQN